MLTNTVNFLILLLDLVPFQLNAKNTLAPTYVVLVYNKYLFNNFGWTRTGISLGSQVSVRSRLNVRRAAARAFILSLNS